jgi:hypothetical protein
LVLFYKYLLVLEGNPEYELNFNESDVQPVAARVRTATMATFQELVEHLVGSRQWKDVGSGMSLANATDNLIAERIAGHSPHISPPHSRGSNSC